MGFVKWSSWDVYLLNIKWLKEGNPYFEVVKYGEWDNKMKEQWVEWVFLWVEQEEKEVNVAGKPKKIKEVRIHLKDGDNKYVIRGTWTSIMRSLLNKLANVQIGQAVRILIGNYNGKNFISVKRGNEKVNWAFTWDEMKSLIKEFEVNWETIRDYSALNDRLIDKVAKYNKQYEQDLDIVPEDDEETEFDYNPTEEKKEEKIPF